MAILLCLLVSSAIISKELEMQIENLNNNENLTVIIVMNTEYPYAEVENLPVKQKADIFREIAYHSQKDVIEYLKSLPEGVREIEQFWIFNGLHVTATKRVIKTLLERSDIKYILHNGIINLPRYEKSDNIRLTEWNIIKVRADSCWNAGYTGDNVLIGFLDSGCNFSHPALSGKWSGYWKDCVNNQTQPYDDNGHGIFAAGIICGGDGSGPFVDDIGAAPGARLVCAKVFNQSGAGQYVWIDAGMQWIADLKTDSGVDIKAVSNSWSGSGTDLHFWSACLTWKAIGILGIWSLGSGGPGPGTCGAPGNYPLVLGSGATDENDNSASFSPQGPAPNFPPWNDTIYWFRTDWNLTKPDIVAPGVNIRSSYNNGSYTIMSGTSWANPHIAGGVAIVCEANSNLTVAQLYNLFLDNADTTPGGGNPNNTYGWGRLNIWRALQSVLAIDEKKCDRMSGQIIISPNPCYGQINITLADYNCPIVIYDIGGRKVFSTNLVENNNILILPESLRNGIYFLKIGSQSRAIMKKFVLLR